MLKVQELLFALLNVHYLLLNYSPVMKMMPSIVTTESQLAKEQPLIMGLGQ